MSTLVVICKGCVARRAIVAQLLASGYRRIHERASGVPAGCSAGAIGLSIFPRERRKDARRFRQHLGDLEPRSRTDDCAGPCEEDGAGEADASARAWDADAADAAVQPSGPPGRTTASAWHPGAELRQERSPRPRGRGHALCDSAAAAAAGAGDAKGAADARHAKGAANAGNAKGAADAGNAKSPGDAWDAGDATGRPNAGGASAAQSSGCTGRAFLAASSRRASDAASADDGGDLDQHETTPAHADQNGGPLRQSNPGVSQCCSRRTAPVGLSDSARV